MKNKDNITFEVVDKNTTNFLEKINKPELLLLIQMLEDLKSDETLRQTVEAYGYDRNLKQWDENTLTKYKETKLTPRILEHGYTFFKLYKDGELIALASGNVNLTDKQDGMTGSHTVRLLNGVVKSKYKEQGFATMLSGFINNWVCKKDIFTITAPMSKDSQDSKNIEKFTHVAEKLGYNKDEFSFSKPNSGTGQIDFSVTIRELKAYKVLAENKDMICKTER